MNPIDRAISRIHSLPWNGMDSGVLNAVLSILDDLNSEVRSQDERLSALEEQAANRPACSCGGVDQ